MKAEDIFAMKIMSLKAKYYKLSKLLMCVIYGFPFRKPKQEHGLKTAKLTS